MAEETPSEKMRLSRKRFIGGIAGAGMGLGIAGVLAACGGTKSSTGATEEAAPTTAAGEQTAAKGKPLVIGSAYPLTTSDGAEMKGGSNLAVAEINASGGVAGREIVHDPILDFNNFDGASVTDAFNKLVSAEVDAVILGYHNVMDPNTILAAYGAPFLNASTSTDQVAQLRSDPAKFANIFQVDPTEAAYGLGFPAFLDNLIAQGTFTPPKRTIHIFEGDIPYSTSISKNAQTAAAKDDPPWEIVGVEPIAGTGGPVTDWTPQIAKVKDSGATVTFNTHWNPADHAALMKQWAADPPDSFLYLQYGASVPEFLELAGDAANGVVWATVLGVYNDAVAKAFQDRYMAKWGKVAGFSNSGTGYDEVNMLARMWGKTGDPKDFKANVAALRSMIHRGVAGGYWFEHDPDINYCLSYPSEIADPSLGNAHEFFQILPDDSGNLQHLVISPAPYVQTPYVKQPWLSF